MRQENRNDESVREIHAANLACSQDFPDIPSQDGAKSVQESAEAPDHSRACEGKVEILPDACEEIHHEVETKLHDP